ncbi:MAG: flagellar basal body P-ring formation chaperone FlgA [Rhodobacteraceae bacterium]|nr:flagellar basal body P-ring formation chaperone FlgA [Paracoccaceae bacterium]
MAGRAIDRTLSRALATLLVLATLLAAGISPFAAQEAGAQANAKPGQVVTAARTIRAGEVLSHGDLALRPGGAYAGQTVAAPEQVVGRETRVAIYAGRPINPGDLRAPSVVRRNDLVTLMFQLGGLQIQTEGRALEDGGLGERIRVMNLDSRRTVSGEVAGPKLVVTK